MANRTKATGTNSNKSPKLVRVPIQLIPRKYPTALVKGLGVIISAGRPGVASKRLKNDPLDNLIYKV